MFQQREFWQVMLCLNWKVPFPASHSYIWLGKGERARKMQIMRERDVPYAINSVQYIIKPVCNQTSFRRSKLDKVTRWHSKVLLSTQMHTASRAFQVSILVVSPSAWACCPPTSPPTPGFGKVGDLLALYGLQLTVLLWEKENIAKIRLFNGCTN